MPGGLLQLAAVGAQNELVNGNPSMTHFRAVYRRHTNFAMEHIRLDFTASNLELNAANPRTISVRLDRFTQLLHDCYLSFTLPDIYSPLVRLAEGVLPPTGYDQGSRALGYEFRWIENIGYNMIERATLTFNGQVIQELRGEWMKMYSYLTHDETKRAVVDEMVGNVPELYDPANARDRQGQYPHAISVVSNTGLPMPMSRTSDPSIRSRQLWVPLHFWFCENPGTALPLTALQNTEIFINITFRALQDLYTVVDVNSANRTYGRRVRPVNYPISLFLSPPTPTGTPSNTALTTFFPDPYVEANFIYLTETEMNQLARADQTVLVRTARFVSKEGQFGANTDMELPIHNLVTRLVFCAQRSDKILANDWDNYTNWDDRKRSPLSRISDAGQTQLFSAGQQQLTSVYPRDTVVNGVLLLDGKEREAEKPLPFFSLLQMYKYSTGETPRLPGVYMYSFALDHTQYQPSGALNGSMFNKVTLRLTLQQPLPESVNNPGQTSQIVCVLKSSLFGPNPVIIPAGEQGLYNPTDIVTVVQTLDNVNFTYLYTVSVYVESLQFLRITSGLASFVFAS